MIAEQDRTLAWTERFHVARVTALAPLISEGLIEEHRANPRGEGANHSHELQLVLNFIHAAPIQGKSFAYCTRPNEEYYLGVMQGRGSSPEIDRSTVYKTEREAVHAVFMQRLHATGLLASGESL